MKLTKDKQSGRYKVRIYTSNGPRTISTLTQDREEAVKFVEENGLRKLEHQAKSGRMAAAAQMAAMAGNRITLQEAVGQWVKWLPNTNANARTVENYASHARTWLGSISKARLHPSQVTPDDIHNWVNAPLSKVKLSTRNVRLAAIRSLFEFCSAKGLCAGNPSKLVRVKLNHLTHEQRETRKRRPFTDEEIDEVVEHCPAGSFWHVAIKVARHVGLRLGDICQLEWKCLASPGKIVVWLDKTDQRLELPLPVPVQRAIYLVPSLDDTYLFPEQRAAILDPKRRSVLSVQFARLCAKAGVEGKSFHSLRCTYAVELGRMGRSLPQISAALGHQNTKVTERYL